MRLAPMESAFIVFETPASAVGAASVAANYPEMEELMTISAPWKVTLTPMVGKGKTMTMAKLHDLTLDPDYDVRHFSGTVGYKTSFKLPAVPAGKRIVLDLGNVREMAKVKVNGKDAGGVWTAPYTIDVTDLLKKGKNEIEVEVVTTWVNRLVADSQLSDDDNKEIDALQAANNASREEQTKVVSDYAATQPIVGQLIDLALLGNGMLRGADLSRFINRSLSLL